MLAVLMITHLTDEDDVRVTTQECAQRNGKCVANLGLHLHLAHAGPA